MHRSPFARVAGASAAGLLGVLTCTPAHAEEAAPDASASVATSAVLDEAYATFAPRADEPAAESSSPWKFRLTPYFMIAAMDGDVTVKGHRSSVDQDFSDACKLMKDHLNFGFAGHFEAEKGRWGLLADFSYMDLRAEKDSPSGEATIDAALRQFIGEAGGFYTLIEPAGDPAQATTWRVDALAGVRATSMTLEIDRSTADPVKKGHRWLDPFIGARVEVGLAEWVSAKLRGDIGGFGLDPGRTSQLVWQVDAGLSFHLTHSLDLDAGYKWLDYDYKAGSGSKEFAYDMLLSGPYMGMTIRF